MPTCIRVGKVEVRGTTERLCSKHSTKKNHDDVRERHDQRHPERIGHV
jgi:hypothetical protein